MKILGTIFYYLFILAVVFIVIGLIGTQTPLFGSFELRIVQSGSMEPAIKTGSLVFIYPEERYVVGDVITFGGDARDQVPTTHRIVSEELIEGNLQYVTKGDANEEEDVALVDPGDVIGSVRFHIPYLGFVIDFARTPIGFLSMIVFPAVLVVLDEGMTIYREIRAKKEDPKDDLTTP